MTRDKKILIYLMIMQKLDLNPFTNQNKINQKEQVLKILTPKQMLQRLPIALEQVKAGNNSEGLLNEIRQIVKTVKANHKKSIQQHNRIYSIKFHATYKRWTLYL